MTDKELFETFNRDVYSFCYYMMQRREDAEDLCQETFIRALLADRSSIQDIRRWLIQIAANLCKNSLRRSKAGVIKEKLFSYRHLAATPHSVEETVEGRELALELSRLYGRLPANIRMVMILRYINGLSQQEIADMIGVPLGTVKSRINKGLSLMRKYIAKPSCPLMKGENDDEPIQLGTDGTGHFTKA